MAALTSRAPARPAVRVSAGPLLSIVDPEAAARVAVEAADGPGGAAFGAGAEGVDAVAFSVGAAAPGSGSSHGSAPSPGSGAAELARRYGFDLDAVIAAEKVTGKVGDVTRVPVLAPSGLPGRVLLVGTGGGTVRDLRRAAASLGRAARGCRHLVTTLGDGTGREGTRAVVEGLLLGAYTPPAAGLRLAKDSPALRVTLVGAHPPDALALGLTYVAATTLARDLAETPSNVKNPGWLADRARELGVAAGLTAEVWDERRLVAEGFGGVLAVGSGSATPPRFVRLDYVPEGTSSRRSRKPIVLVGKGITYDTGGISIKPRESMVPMKTDMSGAAAVLAAVLACTDLGVRRPVTALLPLAENAFGASSYRPGDVVTARGGRTVEILNTDAEGRMILADALAYAAGTLDPEVIVDIATLTGAAALGLGRRHAALYATDDRLAAALTEAGRASGEEVWRMPLVEDYRSSLDSPVADIRQVPGNPAPGGGSITAALFLREFTGGKPWAHLDIAGPARSDRDEYEITRGATGWGARLLLRWLQGLR
jgi:leucyl aminopeptidase